MSVINLRGYSIDFPYPVPYGIQKTYMDKVLQCLEEKTHAVLESPTGTGKTLCLFAPVTAWAIRKKEQNSQYRPNESSEFFNCQVENKAHLGPWGSKTKSKVWYTARTHSQIAQTVSEIRKCKIEGLHVRVMGARDQLCVNELILEEKSSYVKTVKCKELTKNRKCKYYNKLSHEKDFHRFYQKGEVMDVEDLVSIGKSCGICPYFLAKKASETADIVLLPYNYIIDKESRESNGLYLQNDVIIFDEGHNVPSTCEESYEFSLGSIDIAVGIKNIQELMVNLTSLTDASVQDDEVDLAAHASNSMKMLDVLMKLESGLQGLPPSNELLPVSQLYKFFNAANINEKSSKDLLEAIVEFKNDSGKLMLSGSILETFNLMEKILNILFGATVKSFDKATIERSFKCGITIDSGRHDTKKLSLFCFNPSFGIKSLIMVGAQSIIITSGTLSPLKTFISELCLPKPITLENGHIAKKCQVPFIILGTGVNNVKMDGAYKNRNDSKYISSLGMTLTNLIASIPDGVLLLFSSYSMMQNLKESWDSDLGIWNRLNSLKRVFVEPKNKEEFINCLENYRRSIDVGNGAILMGVLRGKISEGMDFKDQYCRGVFIIGVPFPPVQDPRVKGKEKYAESLTVYNPETKMEEKLYNNSFMSIEAMKTTNQAIGRVIRHGNDYGVIVLVDYRFAWPRLFQNISPWLKSDCAVESNFPTSKKLITDFFRSVYNKKLGVKEIRCQKIDSNGSPIVSNESYEEYDHKKHTRHPSVWIGLTPQESSTFSSTFSKSQSESRRGHSKVEYVDEFDPRKLISKYRVATDVSSQKNFEPCQKNKFLLDALESSRNSSVGFRDIDKNNIESIVNKNKRKYEKDENDKDEEFGSKNACLQISSSLFTSPEATNKSERKKYSHIKVRPLLSATDNASDESLKMEQKISVKDLKKKEFEDDLKTKLINYYKQARQELSKEDDNKFKSISCKYMKGEVIIADVIKVMDEMFLMTGHKHLFAGFSICVKCRDKEEWTKACLERQIL